jgi:hypothetical protein
MCGHSRAISSHIQPKAQGNITDYYLKYCTFNRKSKSSISGSYTYTSWPIPPKRGENVVSNETTKNRNVSLRNQYGVHASVSVENVQ